MLYNTLYQFSDTISAFNIFRYLTFRTGGAMTTALIVSFIFGPAVIGELSFALWLVIKGVKVRAT